VFKADHPLGFSRRQPTSGELLIQNLGEEVDLDPLARKLIEEATTPDVT
jgi:hypothetical protein